MHPDPTTSVILVSQFDLSVTEFLTSLAECSLPDVSAEVSAALPAVLERFRAEHKEQVLSWACTCSLDAYVAEMLEITHVRAGFHGGANNVQPDDLEKFNITDLALKLRALRRASGVCFLGL